MRKNEFFCVKCKSHVTLPKDKIKQVMLKNGRPALSSKCDKCKTKVFKFIKLSEAKRSRSKSKKRSGRKSRRRSH